jgi:hypothetical protein
MDDVYYVVPGPDDEADGQEPKVYVSTTQGLKKVERRHSNNSDRLIFCEAIMLPFSRWGRCSQGVQ